MTLPAAFVAKVKSGRVPCLVPFCTVTAKPGYADEMICRKHWIAVPKHLRARQAKLQRLYIKRPSETTGRALDRIWDKIRLEAVLAAAYSYA